LSQHVRSDAVMTCKVSVLARPMDEYVGSRHWTTANGELSLRRYTESFHCLD